MTICAARGSCNVIEPCAPRLLNYPRLRSREPSEKKGSVNEGGEISRKRRVWADTKVYSLRVSLRAVAVLRIVVVKHKKRLK